MKNLSLYAILLLTTISCSQKKSKTKTLTLYSARKEILLKPLLELYTKKTGVNFKLKTGKAGPLLEMIKAEKSLSPADLFLTVDAGNLWQAKETGIFSSTESEILNKNIPAHLKDPDNHWFGLSIRARTIIHNDNVTAQEIKNYAHLGNPQFKAKLCLRTSQKVYNQSLVSTIIKHHGPEKALEIVKSWVSNLAIPPLSNDTKVIESIKSKVCDLGIVNTYYLARLIDKDPQYPVKIFWPNQNSTGVHVNVSGAGIVKTSKQKKLALNFLEWLSSKEAQSLYAQVNHEYPVLKNTSLSSVTQKWGDFKQDKLNVSWAGKMQKESVQLMNKAGYK